MTEAHERRQVQLISSRLDQLVDDVATLLAEIRQEIARERQARTRVEWGCEDA